MAQGLLTLIASNVVHASIIYRFLLSAGFLLAQEPSPSPAPTADVSPTPIAPPTPEGLPAPLIDPAAAPSLVPATEAPPPLAPDAPLLAPDTPPLAPDAPPLAPDTPPPAPPEAVPGPSPTQSDTIPIEGGAPLDTRDIAPARPDEGMPDEAYTEPDALIPDDGPVGPPPPAPTFESAQEKARQLSIRYREVRVQAEKDPKVVSLFEQAERAKTLEDQRAAMREYYRLLFKKIARHRQIPHRQMQGDGNCLYPPSCSGKT